MLKPFFSIIIPLYNREKRITKALDSLESQTFQDFETIVIDDCSEDNSFEIAKKHPLKNKIVIKNNVNLERSETRNIGISKANGMYICFLDSDDYHLELHLELLKNLITKNKYKKAFFFSNSINETENGLKSKRTSPKLNNQNIFSYLMKYTINPQRWAVHNEVMKNHLFDSKINICEDLDVTLRIAANRIEFIQLSEETTVYVNANDSFTQSDPLKNQKEFLGYLKIFERKELKKKLNKKDKNRLLSKCQYFFAVEANFYKHQIKCLNHIIRSFYLYPKSYNGKTNKIMFVMFIYNIPILGYFLNKIIKALKNG